LSYGPAPMIDVDDLLRKTSRTFALAIPLLPEPTRRAVSVAYLLFRVADTLEDATEWPRASRVVALGDFVTALGDRSAAPALRARWLATPPCRHEGYLELLGELPGVLAELDRLPPRARAIIVRHATRTAEGMARVVTRGSEHGVLTLGSVEELRDYCYLVAGIVGELLTELFLNDAVQLESVRADLEADMVLFGEGLQLVNILKDERADAGDGRSYMPPAVPRAEVLELARRDLVAARRYIDALRRARAPRGFVAFTSLCVSLASASLDRLDAESGAKLTRQDVFGILERVKSLV